MTADRAPPMIEVADLWKSFGPVEVLKGISLTVERGAVVAVIGPSGSGKSTLLRCLNLLETPDRGTICIGERRMGFGPDRAGNARLRDRELAAFRAATGMVFQHFNLFPHMTALDNVMSGPVIVKRTPRREAAELGRDLLAKVGLADKADSYPSHLSGGQRQRVAIARALVKRPTIILADEPTGNLDSKSGGEVIELLHELASDGATLVLITHDHGVAASFARRIQMHDGELVADE
jgi:polar amino acid transport system ATP-binding protein